MINLKKYKDFLYNFSFISVCIKKNHSLIIMKKILLITSVLFFCVGIGISQAQESMIELEKLRKKEEKERKKSYKKEKKAKYSQNQGPSDEQLFHLNKKKSKKSRNKKYRKNNTPKASDRLSRENQQRNYNRVRYRKGSNGVTKAAKGQKRAEKRRKRAIR